GGAKPDGSLPKGFSVPDEHKKFGGVRKVQLDKVQYKRAIGGGMGGKPIDGAKTEEVGEMESHFYDGVYKFYDAFVDRPVGELLGGIEKLAKYASDKFMEHPYFYTAAVAVGLGGAAADAAFNNSKITKSAADYAKNPGKIVVGASGFIGGLGELMKGNQPPVVDSIIANNTQPHAGDTVRFDASAHDPDGDPIARYEWQIEKGGKTETAVTPTPTLEKVLEKGSYSVKARAFDGKGASGAAQMNVDVGRNLISSRQI
ncbi:MAG: PKD domain-containing protein, partial [Candidatus Aenigmatarchaeota archaeon]